MKRICTLIVVFHCLNALFTASAQSVISGRLRSPEYPGSDSTVPITAVHCFASLPGPHSQSIGFRTWETHPAGWYYLPGPAGNYSIIFSNPAGYARPTVLTNQYVNNGDKRDYDLSPSFDYADFRQSAWDTKPARAYWQTFTAKGTSITHIGFKLATDGVDGPGPQSQNVLVSIHKKTAQTPDKWPQIGPTAIVLDVDCGGAKNYWWSTAWDSNQVPTTPGQTYAVNIRPEPENGVFQAFWTVSDAPENNCCRLGPDGKKSWTSANLCMTIASDSDGLLIPYNKQVHKKYLTFAGFDRSWSQTYIARGRSLASVILYAATSGVQPSIMRQRLKVSVRENGPDGTPVGTPKIAIGNGNFTGDASWGVFGVSFAPGEVELTPGKRYAVEFESIETFETLDGYVNIKNMPSDNKPGFNPYRKNAPDDYPDGTAYRKCTQPQDFDLDMQIVEYQYTAKNWQDATEGDNLVKNGDMEQSSSADNTTILGWKNFDILPETIHLQAEDKSEKTNHVARIVGGDKTGKQADGGFVQAVKNLDNSCTYRLTCQIRSTWPIDEKHACMVGYDLTGQDSNPTASTIQWTLFPNIHGRFEKYQSPPINPEKNSISIWLRGKTTLNQDFVFHADFDKVKLLKTATGTPK